MPPRELAATLAQGQGARPSRPSVSRRSAVIGADQVVALRRGRSSASRGPWTRRWPQLQLARMAGRAHELITATVVLAPGREPDRAPSSTWRRLAGCGRWIAGGDRALRRYRTARATAPGATSWRSGGDRPVRADRGRGSFGHHRPAADGVDLDIARTRLRDPLNPITHRTRSGSTPGPCSGRGGYRRGSSF